MNGHNLPVSKNCVAFGLSLALCSLLNAALVIAKESSKTVSHSMQALTGHHWITHVAVILVIYFVLGWALGKTNNGAGPPMLAPRLIATVAGGLLGGLAIVLFYYLVAG